MLADPWAGPRQPPADLLVTVLSDGRRAPAQRFSVSELVT
jgi:hypothetical protein